jgi:hypothetical protein
MRALEQVLLWIGPSDEKVVPHLGPKDPRRAIFGARDASNVLGSAALVR